MASAATQIAALTASYTHMQSDEVRRLRTQNAALVAQNEELLAWRDEHVHAEQHQARMARQFAEAAVLLREEAQPLHQRLEDYLEEIRRLNRENQVLRNHVSEAEHEVRLAMLDVQLAMLEEPREAQDGTVTLHVVGNPLQRVFQSMTRIADILHRLLDPASGIWD